MPLLTRFLVDMKKDVAPIQVFTDSDDAKDKLDTIQKAMPDTIVNGKEVVFSLMQEGEQVFLVAHYKTTKIKCPTTNEYCKQCGIFHWSFPIGMIDARKKEIKLEAYKEYAQRR
jgi:uncharacterized protein (DUF608 family)